MTILDISRRGAASDGDRNKAVLNGIVPPEGRKYFRSSKKQT
ncbi:MAG: hypothetical protein OEY64_07075 [Nitrospinota bacterium]|nr:hypothetical protein [Nitrospinota bacterium]